MSKLKSLFAASSAVVLVLGALVTLSSASATAATKHKAKVLAPYKVGVIADLTGGEASTSITFADGAAAYFKTINKKGGVKGHKVSFKIADSQSTPTAAAADVEAAVSNHDLAILDGTGSASIPAQQAALGSSPIPFLSYGTSDTSLYPTPVSNEYMFAPSALQQATACVNEVKALLGGSLQGKTIAFTGLDVPYITGMESDVVNDVTPLGATVSQDQLYPFGVSSFTAQASLVAAAKPDAVIEVGTPADIIIAVDAMNAAGMTSTPMVSYSNGADANTFTEINSSNYYAYRAATYPSPGTAIYKAVVAEGYKSGTTSSYISIGWAMAATVAKALSSCKKTCTANQVNAYMSELAPYTIPDDAFYGPVKASTTDHAVVTSGQFYTYNTGTKTVVEVGKPVKF